MNLYHKHYVMIQKSMEKSISKEKSYLIDPTHKSNLVNLVNSSQTAQKEIQIQDFFFGTSCYILVMTLPKKVFKI